MRQLTSCKTDHSFPGLLGIYLDRLLGIYLGRFEYEHVHCRKESERYIRRTPRAGDRACECQTGTTVEKRELMYFVYSCTIIIV